jgi:hypothetical protein
MQRAAMLLEYARWIVLGGICTSVGGGKRRVSGIRRKRVVGE